jgi:hypothetical protein
MKKNLGIVLLLIAVALATSVAAAAFVYESGSQQVTQTVKNIATLTLQNSALGNIEEGQTVTITKTTVSSLGAAVTLVTTKDNVYLKFDSDINLLNSAFSSYTVTAKYASVGSGSSSTVGSTACSMTIVTPDPSAITLDKAGTWVLDFEISATAKAVSSDQATTITINVSAQSDAS